MAWTMNYPITMNLNICTATFIAMTSSVTPLLVGYSSAIDIPDCTTYYLDNPESPESSYIGHYRIRPSSLTCASTRYYKHSERRYFLYRASGTCSQWVINVVPCSQCSRLNLTLMYSLESTWSLENVHGPWVKEGLPNHNVRLFCSDPGCSTVSIKRTVETSDHVDIDGNYHIRSNSSCHNRPTYVKYGRPTLHLYYYVTSGWRGWMVSSEPGCSGNGVHMVAQDDAYHPYDVSITWSIKTKLGWIYDNEATVHCFGTPPTTTATPTTTTRTTTHKPAPSGDQCSGWRKATIGISTTIALVVCIWVVLTCYNISCSEAECLKSDEYPFPEESTVNGEVSANRCECEPPVPNTGESLSLLNQVTYHSGDVADDATLPTGHDISGNSPPPDYDTVINADSLRSIPISGGLS